MYKRRLQKLIVASFVILETVGLLWVNCPTARCQDNKAMSNGVRYATPTLATKLTYPLLPATKALKAVPHNVEIYQYDDTPLGNRYPLLMIHGLRGEFQKGFRWNLVTKQFLKDPDFCHRFKIYYLRWDTYALLSKIKPQFQKAINELSCATDGKPITIMALSMGGNLVQESMEDISVQTSIDKVLALGAPFHGSPLFCYDWLRYSIIKNHDVPWVRADLCLSYKLYFKLHPNLTEDLRWDNADNGIPQLGKFSTWFPFHISGDLDVNRMNNPRILHINDHLKVDKKKFICYGGYLLTEYVTPHKFSRVWKAICWPWWFATCTLPYHMGYEHPVLRALNYEMGRMVINGGKDRPVVLGSARYGLNDGISPLASALFLPTQELVEYPISREPSLSTVRRSIDVGTARVFRQIDHISFIDGYRPMHLRPALHDELAPELGKRDIFSWMLVDLLGREKTIAKR